MTDGKKIALLICGFIGACIAVNIVVLKNARNSIAPSTTQEESAPSSSTEATIEQPETCKHARSKTLAYVVTGIVSEHLGVTQFDAISFTKPPVRLGAVRMVIPHSMARGDMYVKDFMSCDAGKTWKDGNIYLSPGPRMNEQQVEMMERAITLAR